MKRRDYGRWKGNHKREKRWKKTRKWREIMWRWGGKKINDSRRMKRRRWRKRWRRRRWRRWRRRRGSKSKDGGLTQPFSSYVSSCAGLDRGEGSILTLPPPPLRPSSLDLQIRRPPIHLRAAFIPPLLSDSFHPSQSCLFPSKSPNSHENTCI